MEKCNYLTFCYCTLMYHYHFVFICTWVNWIKSEKKKKKVDKVMKQRSKEQTLPPSMQRTSMTTAGALFSHTRRQKSLAVWLMGPWVAMYSFDPLKPWRTKNSKLGLFLQIYIYLSGGVVVYWSIHSTLTLRARVRISPSPRHFCPSARQFIHIAALDPGV